MRKSKIQKYQLISTKKYNSELYSPIILKDFGDVLGKLRNSKRKLITYTSANLTLQFPQL